jgi:glycosyltransferase involved in cell wall biosynthesis
MNGGMNYPPAFAASQGWTARVLLAAGRAGAAALNFVIPGKRQAALLLVANERTRAALPRGTCPSVRTIAENGVDLALWQPPETTGGGLEEITTFVFMGRLIGLKCVDLLLRAFARARREAPMRLWVLGDGAERARLEDLAADLGIRASDPAQAGGAHFAGWLSQASCKERLSRADCLVLPSVRECGGAVVLEAMSLGKPVIATAWGGPLDYLDASCGVLVPPDSRDGFIDGIQAAMLRIASSPLDRLRMGQSAFAKVRAEYTWSSKAERIVALYAQAVQSHGPRETGR